MKTNQIRILLAPILYMAMIWILSSIPGGSFNVKGMDWLMEPTTQNLLHIPLYGGLAYIWMISLGRLEHNSPRMLAAILTIGYGIIDECHQAFVPGRYAAVTDVALDGVGAAVALVLVSFLPSIRISCNKFLQEEKTR